MANIELKHFLDSEGLKVLWAAIKANFISEQAVIELLGGYVKSETYEQFVTEVTQRLDSHSTSIEQINQKIQEIQAIVAVYDIEKEIPSGVSDFVAIYHLTKNGERVGAPINIPKDQVLVSVTVEICQQDDNPPGLKKGEKYLHFVWASGPDTNIAIKDIIAPYIAGDGISISGNNIISVENRTVQKLDNQYGTSIIFNEEDGGGAKFEGKNGYSSFAGVNYNTADGIGAQLYDINVDENKGSKLDVTATGIYYTDGDKSALPFNQRDIFENKIAVQADIQKKTTQEILSDNGQALIFNEIDGGGAKFTHVDGSEVFVGVNGDGKDGLMAQIYADIEKDGKWSGSRINVYNDKIYYTNQAAVDSGISKNDASHEIATIETVEDSTEPLTNIEILSAIGKLS